MTMGGATSFGWIDAQHLDGLMHLMRDIRHAIALSGTEEALREGRHHGNDAGREINVTSANCEFHPIAIFKFDQDAGPEADTVRALTFHRLDSSLKQ
jgi:hypothetical protein